jgi:hypothetical protein
MNNKKRGKESEKFILIPREGVAPSIGYVVMK